MASLNGQSLGRYHILEQLGEGGMATVYKAYDTRLERDVAVKVLRTELFGKAMLERILKRFEREAKALAKLSHPNIVKVHDYGEHEGAPYLVMEYLPGGTLKQRMGKPFPWQEAARLLLPIAEALSYAHEHNILHRDVKPANILLAEKGQPLLSDFGIAKILDLEDGQTLTATGVGIGTPEYMSPEQGMGQPVGPGTDVYSLGVVLYELITGRKPFQADTPMAVVVKHLNDPLPRPTQFVPGLPEKVEKVLLKALAKKPEDRYLTMGDFAAALENLNSGTTPETVKPVAMVTAAVSLANTQETMDDLSVPVKKAANTSPPPSRNIHAKQASRTQAPSSPPVPDTKQINWKMIIIGGAALVVLAGVVWGGWRLSTGDLFVPAPSETPTHTASMTPTQQPTKTTTHIPSSTQTYTPTVTAMLGQSNWNGSKMYRYPRPGTIIASLSKGDRFEIWGWCRHNESDSNIWLFIQYGQYSGWIQTFDNFIAVLFPEIIDSETLIRQKGLIEFLPKDSYITCPEIGTSIPISIALPLEITDEKGVTMRLVPAGAFTMGSDSGSGSSDEKPVHTVTLDDYYMDVYEVTNAQYTACVDAGECTPPYKTGSDTRSDYFRNSVYMNYPVIYVDWNQAKTYCEWRGARLPTEAEWEKAARGTDGRTYPWSEGIDCSKANYWGKGGGCTGDTTEVGSYESGKSPYGMYDMAGNVWEWVNDWYDSTYYSSSPVENPQGPSSGDSRVLRGGSWHYFENDLRSANRLGSESDFRFSFFGFRCSRDANP